MRKKKYMTLAAAMLTTSYLFCSCGVPEILQDAAGDTQEEETVFNETESPAEDAETEAVTETTEAAEAMNGPEWYSIYQITDQPLTADINGDGETETVSLMVSDTEEGNGECRFVLQMTDASGTEIASYEVTRTDPDWYADFNMFVFAEEYEGTTYLCYQVSTDLNPYCLTYGVLHMDGSTLVKDLVLYERDYENAPGLYDCTALNGLEYYFDEGIVLYDAQEHQDDSADVMYNEYELALDQAIQPYGLSKEKMWTHGGEMVSHNYVITAEEQQDIYVVYGSPEQ